MSRIQFQAKGYSQLFFTDGDPREEFEKGDKILLSPDVLENVTKGRMHLPNPIIFEVKNRRLGRTSHCGVLEFSANAGQAILPKWMMENLAISETPGQELYFILKEHVPKAKKITLRPLEAAFAQIATPKQTLEYALSKFTALTEGDTFTIQKGRNTYSFTCSQVEPKKKGMPNPVVQLIDTSVTVEFEEMTGPAAESNEHRPIDELPLNQSTPITVSPDSYIHVRYKHSDKACTLSLSLDDQQGNGDVYVATQYQPTMHKYVWSTHEGTSTNFNGKISKTIKITPNDSNFVMNWYYISIHAYKVALTCAITVTEEAFSEETVDQASSNGRMLKMTESDDPDAEQCDNCRSFVPKRRLLMHSATCARNNWWCKECDRVYRKSEQAEHTHCLLCNQGMNRADMEKHMDVMHRMIVCDCGLEVNARDKEKHNQEDCRLRLRPCRFCKMMIEDCDEAHESYCGSKTEACSVCGKPIAIKQMSVHRAIEHSINDSAGGHGTSRFNRPPPGFLLKNQRPQRPSNLPPANSGFIRTETLSGLTAGGPMDVTGFDDSDAAIAAATAASLEEYFEKEKKEQEKLEKKDEDQKENGRKQQKKDKKKQNKEARRKEKQGARDEEMSGGDDGYTQAVGMDRTETDAADGVENGDSDLGWDDDDGDDLVENVDGGFMDLTTFEDPPPVADTASAMDAATDELGDVYECDYCNEFRGRNYDELVDHLGVCPSIG